jgi:hypothetical protein
MNLCGSLPNHENRTVYKGTPLQGISEARQAGVFFYCLFLIRRGGNRLRGGGNHRTGRSVKKISYHTRIVQFSGKCSITSYTSHGGFTRNWIILQSHKITRTRILPEMIEIPLVFYFAVSVNPGCIGILFITRSDTPYLSS